MNLKTVRAVSVVLFLFATASLHAQVTADIQDTDLHILAGASVALGCTSAILFAFQADEPHIIASLAAAGGAAITAGVGKEIFDYMGFGTPEFRDIINTAAGGLVGMTTLAFALTAFPGRETSSDPELKYTFLTISASLLVPLVVHVLKTLSVE